MDLIELHVPETALSDPVLGAMISRLFDIRAIENDIAFVAKQLSAEEEIPREALDELEEALMRANVPYNIKFQAELGGTARYHRPENGHAVRRTVQWGLGLIDPVDLLSVIAKTPDNELRQALTSMAEERLEDAEIANLSDGMFYEHESEEEGPYLH